MPKAVADIRGGKIDFRVDKQANPHFVIGEAAFHEKKRAGSCKVEMQILYAPF